MRQAPPIAAIVGISAGLVLVVATLALEIVARGLPLRGGLVQLQVDSVAVWVVESLPIVFGLAGWGLARAHVPAPAPVVGPTPAPLTPLPAARRMTPPPPPPLAIPAVAEGGAPPPVPPSLQTVNLLDTGAESHRVKALQELLRKVKEQADRSGRESRAKSGWLASLGQEVREPLNEIVGTAEWLLEEPDQRTAADRELGQVVMAGRRLLELVGPMSDLARVETGQMTVIIDNVDLAQVFDELRSTLKRRVEASEGSLSLRVAPGSRQARGDHRRMRDVMQLVLSFLLDPQRRGVQVQVAAERVDGRRDGMIAIRFRCLNARLPVAVIKAAFDPYQRVGASARVVGLTVSRQLVELMGGRIEVSDDDTGALRIDIILPPSASTDPLRPRSTVPLNERLAGLRMIIADPQPTGLTVANRLERTGVEVVHVADGASARGAWIEQRADIVIADAAVPGIWDAVQAIADDDGEVVVTSLYDEDVEKALERGVTAFLTKPYELDLMVATLERCLEPE